jgi:hypothetical protein
MNIYIVKQIIALLAAVAVMAIIPTGVYAVENHEPASIEEKTRVIQEFTYKAGDSPSIPEKISQFGEILILISVTEPKESKSLPKNRTYSYKVSKYYSPTQLSQVPGNVKVTPLYGEGSRQVDREETIRNLSNNDVDKLPVRRIYTDTDGVGPGASVKGDLALAEVRYEVTHRDEYGIPDEYTAHIVYRGEEKYQAILYYEAVATYTGTETIEGESTFTVVATYEGDLPEESAPPSGGNDAGESSLAAGENDAEESYPPAGDAEPEEDPIFMVGTEPSESSPSVSEAESSENSPLSGIVQLPFSLGSISPVGAATLATAVAAVLAILIIGINNRRRIREDSRM